MKLLSCRRTTVAAVAGSSLVEGDITEQHRARYIDNRNLEKDKYLELCNKSAN